MIRVQGASNGTKFIVSKVVNPDTNKASTVATDFSFTIWGEITADYLISVKKLDKRQFKHIFDAALNLTRSAGKYKLAINSATADAHSRSNRADLCSESESDKDDRIGRGGDGHHGSESSGDRQHGVKEHHGGGYASDGAGYASGGGDSNQGGSGDKVDGYGHAGGRYDDSEDDDGHYNIDQGYNDW